MNSPYRNLVICLTPLQMLIAEKIISLNPDSQFDLLVIALTDNKKYRHYFHRLSKFCINSLYYSASPGFLGFLKFIKELRLSELDITYHSIYLSSIDSRHIQYIVSKNKNSYIYTFDDGTANILPDSLYYSDTSPSIIKKLVWRTLGIKYYMKEIKNVSSLHYTIYENVPNIIPNTSLIRLYDKQSEAPDKCISVVRFYLGQPIHEISPYYTHLYLNMVLHNLSINFYYPHPREQISDENTYQIIDSDLVFEDYIVQYLKEHPEVEIEVYSFLSSCLLNISHLHRVKPIYMYDDFLKEKYSSLYQRAKEFNITILNIQADNK